jgi:hypothetical protein
VHFPKAFTLTLKFLRILPHPLYHWIIWRATKGRRLSREATLDS